jgi:hypothetical protein
MSLSRRRWLATAAAALSGAAATPLGSLAQEIRPSGPRARSDLTIKEVRITPIALPDPPILAASGCHGPYFLRTVVEVVTTDGIVGIGETRGGDEIAEELGRAKKQVVGHSAAAYSRFADERLDLSTRAYAGLELACLDAVGRAANLRLCELLGGPVREEPEFAAYLFFRYAADHPALLADRRIVDSRGSGDKSARRLGRGPHARGNGRAGVAVPSAVGIPRSQTEGRRIAAGD